jgi:hypothetical protein
MEGIARCWCQHSLTLKLVLVLILVLMLVLGQALVLLFS